MSSYSDLLKHPKWQKKRLEILQRDGFSCCSCGDKESPLHVHHSFYVKGRNPWEYDNKSLFSLCDYCHSRDHIYKERIAEKLNEIRNIYGFDYHKIIMTVLNFLLIGQPNDSDLLEFCCKYLSTMNPKKEEVNEVYSE